MAAHWSELPRDLLELIVEKLDLIDHARFASVCTSWRSVAVENPTINKPLYFVLSHDPEKLLRRFISSFVSTWKKARFIGAGLDGWLVILIDGRKPFLNRGLNSMIPLPLLSKQRYSLFRRQDLFKAVLSSTPSSSSSSVVECTVVIKHDFAGVFYCRLGSDKSFTMLSNIRDAEDILFYKGRLYVLCNLHRTIVIFDHLLNKISQSELVSNMPKYVTPWHFFVSENDTPSIIAGRRSSLYSVFTLEGSEPRLNYVGEDVILLSNPYCSLSITVKDHKEFRRDTNYFENDISTFVLDMSKDPNKAKVDDPWPLFFVMFSYLGIKNLKKKSRTLLELPRDVFELIFEKLDLADRARFAAVCSSLRSIAKDLGLWDEIGESDLERDKMILQTDLHQKLAEGEVEVSNIISSLGVRESFVRSEKLNGTLKEIKPLLEERQKDKRFKKFSDKLLQIAQISAEISGETPPEVSSLQVDERDLTIKRLEELRFQLQELQRDKDLRLQKVNDHLKSIQELSYVMSVDASKMLCEVHSSFITSGAYTEPKSISNDTLARLAGTVHSLKQEKKQRLHKLQGLGSTLIELWNLMDTKSDEQKRFDHVTFLISSSIDDVLGDGCLSVDIIEQAELEVGRLNILKASKMKELVLKKQNELEQIYAGVHMDVDNDAARKALITIIDSGQGDLSELLSCMNDRIAKAKEQALSRRDILEKVEKWTFASEEESWLDDFERDQNRYNAGRGAHKNLKRAEKARLLVSKIPSLVENLNMKIKAWEKENGMSFLYEKVPLLQTLEAHTTLRQQREEEKRRSREQKRLQEQFAAEQEALFGSKPSSSPIRSVKKPLGTPVGRRVSILGIHSSGKGRKESGKAATVIPTNNVALPKDDSMSRDGNASAVVSP